jgi:hypothetical protein
VSRREEPSAIEQEIAAERLAALARTSRALEAALAAVAAAPPGPERRRLVDEAGQRLWMAVVQREAMGLTRHEVLFETLRVPAEVRARMDFRPGRRRPPAGP